MKGRKAKPTRLKLLAGNPGKRKPDPREPKATGRPSCPEWLSPIARQEWGRIVPVMEGMGILGSIDEAGLVGYCQAYAELAVATETLDREGRTQTTEHGLRQHPAAAHQTRALNTLARYLAEFGMTPASRSKVQSDTIGDDLDEFLRTA